MIIFTRDLNFKMIDSLIASPMHLVSYVESTVPIWAHCFPHIVDNQKFYVATQVRSMLSVAFKVRKAATEALCAGVTLQGLTTEYVTVSEVIEDCSKENLVRLLENYYEEVNP